MSPTFSSRSSKYTFPPRTAGPPKPAAIGTVQSTFGPSCGHVRKSPFCSEVWFLRGPYSHGQSAAKTEVSDNAIMIVTSLATLIVDLSLEDEASRGIAGPRRAFLAYSSTNRTAIAHSSRRFRQTSGRRCLYHCCDDDTFPASPSIHATSPNTQRLQSRPGRRADGFARPAAAPARTPLSQRPAHWRSDGSPIGSRRTPPTTGRFSSGSRAPMPSASRG